MSNSTNFTLASIPDDWFSAIFVSYSDLSWLAEGYKDTRSSILVDKVVDFYSKNNATTSMPQLAELLGTSVHRVQLTYDYYGDGDTFANILSTAQKVYPLMGHPVQSSNAYAAIYAILTLIAMVMVTLRFYSRLTIHGKARSYDWILLVALIMEISFGLMSAILLAGPLHYRGEWDQTWNAYSLDKASSMASDVLYPVIVFLIKSSLLLFYYQLTAWFPLKIATILTFIVVTVNSLCMIFIWIFHCAPALSWIGDAYMTCECNSDLWKKSEVVCGAINIVTDIAIWIIPLPMVWMITQSIRERIFSVATFGIGAVACIACGIRLSTVKHIGLPTDAPPDEGIYIIWTHVELYLAIICSSVPAIRALILKKAPTLLGSSKHTDDSGSKASGSDVLKEKSGPSVITESIEGNYSRDGGESPV